MKITIITYTYSPYTKGGADIYAEKISKELPKRGHEVVIIASNPKKGTVVENRDNIRIYRYINI